MTRLEPTTAAEFAAAARAVKSEDELTELHRRLREDVDGAAIPSEMAKSRR